MKKVKNLKKLIKELETFELRAKQVFKKLIGIIYERTNREHMKPKSSENDVLMVIEDDLSPFFSDSLKRKYGLQERKGGALFLMAQNKAFFLLKDYKVIEVEDHVIGRCINPNEKEDITNIPPFVIKIIDISFLKSIYEHFYNNQNKNASNKSELNISKKEFMKKNGKVEWNEKEVILRKGSQSYRYIQLLQRGEVSAYKVAKIKDESISREEAPQVASTIRGNLKKALSKIMSENDFYEVFCSSDNYHCINKKYVKKG